MTQILTLEGDSLNLCAEELGWGMPKVFRPSTYKKAARKVSRVVRNPKAFVKRQYRSASRAVKNPWRATKNLTRKAYRGSGLRAAVKYTGKAFNFAKRQARKLINSLIGRFVRKYGVRAGTTAVKGAITSASTGAAMSNPVTAPYAAFIAAGVWTGITKAVQKLKLRRKIGNLAKKVISSPKAKKKSSGSVALRRPPIQRSTGRIRSKPSVSQRVAQSYANRPVIPVWVTDSGMPASKFQKWIRGVA